MATLAPVRMRRESRAEEKMKNGQYWSVKMKDKQGIGHWSVGNNKSYSFHFFFYTENLKSTTTAFLPLSPCTQSLPLEFISSIINFIKSHICQFINNVALNGVSPVCWGGRGVRPTPSAPVKWKEHIHLIFCSLSKACLLPSLGINSQPSFCPYMYAAMWAITLY